MRRMGMRGMTRDDAIGCGVDLLLLLLLLLLCKPDDDEML